MGSSLKKRSNGGFIFWPLSHRKFFPFFGFHFINIFERERGEIEEERRVLLPTTYWLLGWTCPQLLPRNEKKSCWHWIAPACLAWSLHQLLPLSDRSPRARAPTAHAHLRALLRVLTDAAHSPLLLSPFLKLLMPFPTICHSLDMFA